MGKNPERHQTLHLTWAPFTRQPLDLEAGNAGNHIFGLHFFATCVRAFERMFHTGQQNHSCFLVFQLVAFTQQAKVRIKMTIEKKIWNVVAINWNCSSHRKHAHNVWKKVLRAQTKFPERYSLRLFEISLEQVICTLFVIFSHPRHPTLASFSN